MCTAATYKTKDFYFGRNLDYEFSYGEQVVVTPRNFTISFRDMPALKNHYAFVGMAYVAGGFPLYYDGINEKGLGVAGLNFVGNAFYRDPDPKKDNIAQFEFMPWILAQCATVAEARKLLEKINITNTAFSPELPPAEQHWMIADKDECIVVESVKEGIKVYDNPAGVLTNNPPFDKQLFALNNYAYCSPEQPKDNFGVPVDLYSRGMGAMGLPGDLSSQSRFIKVAYTRANSVSGDSEEESVSQFFHILHSVDQQKGLTNVGDDKYEITLYSSCGNASKGIYYYTTYNNHQISGVDMNKEDLDGTEIICYPELQDEHINLQN